jgi:phage terminase large subunit
MELITYCFEYPNSRWLMLRSSLPVLRATLLKTFTENFINKGFAAYVKDFNQTTLTLTWNNGSQIIFMAESYDTDKELNRFRGLEINGAFIDEVNEVQEVTFDKVLERAGSWFHSPGCPTKILMSCNPSQGWVKDRFYNKWKDGTLPDGMAYIQAKITDNPHIPADYLESLKMLPRYQYMAFVEGDWDVNIKIGGEFYNVLNLTST